MRLATLSRAPSATESLATRTSRLYLALFRSAAGEVFYLRVIFSDRYPLDPPEVIFLNPPPVHPHIYSNGHICLDILYAGQNGGWSPALTISKVRSGCSGRAGCGGAPADSTLVGRPLRAAARAALLALEGDEADSEAALHVLLDAVLNAAARAELGRLG